MIKYIKFYLIKNIFIKIKCQVNDIESLVYNLKLLNI